MVRGLFRLSAYFSIGILTCIFSALAGLVDYYYYTLSNGQTLVLAVSGGQRMDVYVRESSRRDPGKLIASFDDPAYTRFSIPRTELHDAEYSTTGEDSLAARVLTLDQTGLDQVLERDGVLVLRMSPPSLAHRPSILKIIPLAEALRAGEVRTFSVIEPPMTPDHERRVIEAKYLKHAGGAGDPKLLIRITDVRPSTGRFVNAGTAVLNLQGEVFNIQWPWVPLPKYAKDWAVIEAGNGFRVEADGKPILAGQTASVSGTIQSMGHEEPQPHPDFILKPYSKAELMKKVLDIAQDSPFSRAERELEEISRRVHALNDRSSENIEWNEDEIVRIRATQEMDDVIPRLKAVALWRDDEAIEIKNRVTDLQREMAVHQLEAYFSNDSRALRAIDEIAASYSDAHPMRKIAQDASAGLINDMVDPIDHAKDFYKKFSASDFEEYVQFQEESIGILKERAPHNKKALEALKSMAFECWEKEVWWPAQAALKELSEQGVGFQTRPPRELRKFLRGGFDSERAEKLSPELAEELKLLATDRFPVPMPRSDQKSAFRYLRQAAPYSSEARKILGEIAETARNRELKTWARSTLDQNAEFERCVMTQLQDLFRKH